MQNIRRWDVYTWFNKINVFGQYLPFEQATGISISPQEENILFLVYTLFHEEFHQKTERFHLRMKRIAFLVNERLDTIDHPEIKNNIQALKCHLSPFLDK